MFGLKRGNPWSEDREALRPKWGMAKCELLDQGSNDIEEDCATYAVAQCLLAMGVKDVDNETPNEIRNALCYYSLNHSSIGDNLTACVSLGYIKKHLLFTQWGQALAVMETQPVVLGLYMYDGMNQKDGFDFLSLDGDQAGKHAICATGLEKRWWGREPRFAHLMDTRGSIGRCKIGLSDLRLLFGRCEALCFVPIK